jgi:phosphate transport system permease protein
MSTTTERPSPERHADKATVRRPPRRRFTSLEIGGALVVALGVVLVARAALGIGVVAAVILAYLTFVAVIAFVELSSARSSRPETIDLTGGPDASTEAGAEPFFAPEPRLLHTVTDPPELPDVPMRRRSVNWADFVEGGVAALAAAGIAEGIRVLLRMRSLVGVAAWWYVAFIAIYFLLARDRDDAERALDRVVTMLVWSAGLLVVSVLGWMIATVVAKGLGKLTWGFLTHDLSKTGPLTPGGGAIHAIIGTVEQVGMATVVVVPLGILTAVYLHEVRGRMTKPIRFIVDAMSGLPSIVAGLLLFTLWVDAHGYSGVAGSAALVVLMLPTMTRASEEILRTVPDSLREGALALGSPQWRLVQRVVLPTALAGIVTATLLAIARAIGETAPMILTAFGADATNTNPLHGPQSDLPLFVLKLIFLPNKTQQDRAWTGALILVTLVLVLFVTARLVARRGLRRLEGSR